MADYKKYLAASILTEDKVITYRLLSRAVKVHVNTAKEMLYDFHKTQNAKKPGTISATYLISGTKKPEAPIATNGGVKKDGEDEYMQSSPFMMSSSLPQTEEGTGETHVLSITLVKEENLEEVKSQYEHISSIHIYSLGPHPLKDLQLLTDVTRQLDALTASTEDPPSPTTYGTILNPLVRRRTTKRPPPPPSAPVAVAKPKPAPKPLETKKEPAKKESKPNTTANDFFGKSNKGKGSKENEKEKENLKSKNESGAGSTATSAPSSKESTPNPPTLKRDNSSIFKAFAKAKPPKPKDIDQVMGGLEDDEEENWVPSEKVSKKKEEGAEDGKTRKDRKEREEALRKMMEDDDDDDEIKEEVKEEKKRAVSEEWDIEGEKDKRRKRKSISVEPKEEEIEVKPVVQSGGRRRGRRRIMKKKTVKDEEGYLVTKEEATWESFSEDEPAPPPKSKIPHHPAPTTTSGKGKKGGAAAKQGQGSIMSFFGKK